MSEEPNKNRLHPLYYGNASNQACHPNAPNGGGGCGTFTQAGPLGSFHDTYSNFPHPFSPAARYLTPQEIANGTHGSSGMDWFLYSPTIKEVVDVSFTIAPGMTWDGFWRLIYDKTNSSLQKQATELLKRGNIVQEEARALVDMRNELILRVRSMSTPFGELYAEILKPRASLKSLEQFLAEKGTIEAVLKSVGNTRAIVDRFGAISRVAGPAAIIIEITLTAIVIQEADPKDRGRVAAREIGGIVGGVVGGVDGAWAGCASAALLVSPLLTIPVGGEAIEGGACFFGGILGALGVGWLGNKTGSLTGEGLYNIVNEMSEFSWSKGR